MMIVENPIGIQRKRIKGWRMPPNTVSVCRPGLWGNPYKFGPNEYYKNARTSIIRYERDLIILTLRDKTGRPLLHRTGELKGKNLACFCPIGSPCHRDILLKYANLED
jgi:hypothetical protein